MKEIYCRVWHNEAWINQTVEQHEQFNLAVLNRLDGPSIEYTDGEKVWYKDGKLHRLDGPAVDRVIGPREWHIAGMWMPADADEIETWIDENEIDLSIGEDQMAFKLRWM